MNDPGLSSALALLDRLGPAIKASDRARIVDIVHEFITLRAPIGGQWRQIAQLAIECGEVTLSRQAIDLYVEASGRTPLAQYDKFGLLVATGALDEAYALLETLPDDVPEPAVNAYGRGALAVFLGELEEARGQLERALRLRPGMGEPWLPLSTIVNFADEPDLTDRIVAAASAVGTAPPAARAAYHYALGKAHADRGEHSLAFDAFNQAGKLKNSLVRYDRERDRANAAEAVRGYGAEQIAAITRQQSEPTGRSIFVTGLPRSGTTLVEQILTSHSAVSGGAELNLLRLLWQDVGGLGYPALSSHVASHGAAPAARLWHHLLDERFPAPGRVVDKSTDHAYFFGLVAALLPQAPIIWLTRDPLDCAWSCFRTHFFTGMEWSNDLEDIACHFRLADGLLSRWREILGERLLVVPFESLVTEPEWWIRRILAHCGLAEEPQVFAPHESTRPVMTASVMQVRRPINRQGIGAAEPYRQFLEPFVEAYYR